MPSHVFKVIVVDVGPLSVRESEQKNRQITLPIGDHRTKTISLARSRSGDALLQATAEIRIDQSLRG